MTSLLESKFLLTLLSMLQLDVNSIQIDISQDRVQRLSMDKKPVEVKLFFIQLLSGYNFMLIHLDFIYQKMKLERYQEDKKSLALSFPFIQPSSASSFLMLRICGSEHQTPDIFFYLFAFALACQLRRRILQGHW